MHTTPLGHVFDSSQLTAASALQTMVPELASLYLNAKQAHWNVGGPDAPVTQALSGEIANEARQWTDMVAERTMSLGFTVDARPNTIAATSGQLPAGRFRAPDAIVALVHLVDLVSATTRRAIVVLEASDPVGHALAIEVLQGLERRRWMLRAQHERRARDPGETLDWTQRPWASEHAPS
jgi:starvation-inducible DNA-binding protein